MVTPTSARARLAAHHRHHPDTDDSTLRRDLRAAQLADHLRRVVNAAPALTADQVERLRALLPPAGMGDGG